MPFSLIQLLLLAALAIALAGTLRRGRVGSLSRIETALWSALWISAAVVVLRPDLSSRFAALVGVGRGADAVTYAAIVALFYLVFRLFLRIDKIERDITAVVRRDALDAHVPGKEPRP
jgi:small membrane protein